MRKETALVAALILLLTGCRAAPQENQTAQTAAPAVTQPTATQPKFQEQVTTNSAPSR